MLLLPSPTLASEAIRLSYCRRDANIFHSGLAWHTEEATLRQKFEEFGAVEEAVC